MIVETGTAVRTQFTTQLPTGEAANADSLPTGTLYLNGTANGATVTITNISAGLYKAAFTIPTVSEYDQLELIVSATVDGTAAKGRVWGGSVVPAAVSQPYSSHAPQRVAGTKLTAFLGESTDVSINVTCYDSAKALLHLDGLTLRYSVAPYDDPDSPFLTSDPFMGSGSTFDLVLNILFTAAEVKDGTAHFWSLRAGTEVIQHGRLEVRPTSVGAT